MTSVEYARTFLLLFSVRKFSLLIMECKQAAKQSKQFGIPFSLYLKQKHASLFNAKQIYCIFVDNVEKGTITNVQGITILEYG